MRLSSGEQPEVFQRHVSPWARTMLRLLGGTPRVIGAVPPKGERGRLVVANHRTAFDVLVLWSLFGGSFLARGDIANWPLINAPARYAQTLFVDRTDTTSGVKAIRAVRTALSNGRTVLVFPEGTTYPGDDVRPLHAGAFLATSRLDVEIIPVGLAYPAGVEWYQHSALVHYRRIAAERTIPIGVAVGAPRAPERPKRDATEVREAIQGLVKDARRLL